MRYTVDWSRIGVTPTELDPSRVIRSDSFVRKERAILLSSPNWRSPFMPFGIGPLELIIVLVIVLVIFGPKRLPGLGRSIGTGIREFKDSVSGKSKDEEREQLEADARAHGEAEARHS